MGWSLENLSGERWSGVVGGIFLVTAVVLIVGLTEWRSNVYAFILLVLSPGVGIVAGLLWWRFVEKPNAITYVRGALTGVSTSLTLHLFLVVIMLPFGLLAAILVPVSLLLLFITGPIGAGVGVGMICVRKCFSNGSKPH